MPRPRRLAVQAPPTTITREALRTLLADGDVAQLTRDDAHPFRFVLVGSTLTVAQIDRHDVLAVLALGGASNLRERGATRLTDAVLAFLTAYDRSADPARQRLRAAGTIAADGSTLTWGSPTLRVTDRLTPERRAQLDATVVGAVGEMLQRTVAYPVRIVRVVDLVQDVDPHLALRLLPERGTAAVFLVQRDAILLGDVATHALLATAASREQLGGAFRLALRTLLAAGSISWETGERAAAAGKIAPTGAVCSWSSHELRIVTPTPVRGFLEEQLRAAFRTQPFASSIEARSLAEAARSVPERDVPPEDAWVLAPTGDPQSFAVLDERLILSRARRHDVLITLADGWPDAPGDDIDLVGHAARTAILRGCYHARLRAAGTVHPTGVVTSWESRDLGYTTPVGQRQAAQEALWFLARDRT